MKALVLSALLCCPTLALAQPAPPTSTLTEAQAAGLSEMLRRLSAIPVPGGPSPDQWRAVVDSMTDSQQSEALRVWAAEFSRWSALEAEAHAKRQEELIAELGKKIDAITAEDGSGAKVDTNQAATVFKWLAAAAGAIVPVIVGALK